MANVNEFRHILRLRRTEKGANIQVVGVGFRAVA
ncbi:hypothetical protein EDC02_1160 [Micromonospora sp. Llam0]|nr:hypothetical protein EDC02_1160 [Micromonospora sp. Llam0]